MKITNLLDVHVGPMGQTAKPGLFGTLNLPPGVHTHRDVLALSEDCSRNKGADANGFLSSLRLHNENLTPSTQPPDGIRFTTTSTAPMRPLDVFSELWAYRPSYVTAALLGAVLVASSSRTNFLAGDLTASLLLAYLAVLSIKYGQGSAEAAAKPGDGATQLDVTFPKHLFVRNEWLTVKPHKIILRSDREMRVFAEARIFNLVNVPISWPPLALSALPAAYRQRLFGALQPWPTLPDNFAAGDRQGMPLVQWGPTTLELLPGSALKLLARQQAAAVLQPGCATLYHFHEEEHDDVLYLRLVEAHSRLDFFVKPIFQALRDPDGAFSQPALAGAVIQVNPEQKQALLRKLGPLMPNWLRGQFAALEALMVAKDDGIAAVQTAVDVSRIIATLASKNTSHETALP